MRETKSSIISHGERMPKTQTLKQKAFNKAVSTERKFNTAMSAFNRASNGSRAQKIADFALSQLTPSKDVRKAVMLWNKYSDIKRAAEGKWKKYK